MTPAETVRAAGAELGEAAMTPVETVRAVAERIGELGGAWMRDPATAARGKELGVAGWSFYHCGRGGVLGDVDADVVVAAFGWFPPAVLRKAWDRGRAVLPVADLAREYAGCCAEWGRRTFAEVEQAGRLADLLRAAGDGVDVAGIPLFAGWRALPAPPDDPARLALALQVMREHRGGVHLIAALAQGLAPLQGLVSGRSGPANAQFFGWPEPYPDPAVGREAMTEAERVTDRLAEPAYAALSADERAELVAGLKALPR